MTTRKSELGHLSEGNSLGALPRDKSIEVIRLRFGGIDNGVGSGEEYAAFGTADKEVTRLRRGGRKVCQTSVSGLLEDKKQLPVRRRLKAVGISWGCGSLGAEALKLGSVRD
ncbi:hypothetical protein BDZ45DRAFT_810475 [Acephala macrosclerotiorum]|nr:hypothetical protein BDZ45DRAFT_810475 [Acephala macrosclerotiorum]